MTHHALVLTATIAVPLILGLLVRPLRYPRRVRTDLARSLVDLISLRMVLRDTDPDQRADLLHAHRAWRAEPADQPGRARRPRAGRRADLTV